jgi:putative phosphoesterase
MRIAFISDIHGNFTAFQAVLADINLQVIDQIICLGDVVTLGPQPIEVLNTLREMKCVYIKGNHDAAVINPERAVQYDITDHLIPDMHWCRDKLSPDDLKFLDSFKPMHEINLSNSDSILAFHGSPLSFTDIIQTITPPELLDAYFEGQKSNIFIGGHSHIQMVRRYDDKLILNPGSIGNAFRFVFSPGYPVDLLPWAEYMIINQSGNSLNIDSRRVYFDTDELLKKVKKSHLPCTDWWLRQYSK